MKKIILSLAFFAFLGLPLQAVAASSPVDGAERLGIADMLPKEQIARAGAVKFSGNVKTKKYHSPDCQFYDCADCTRFFKSEAQAKAAGYKACKKCP